MSTIGIILLAAGGSTRLGQPKQLLPWGGNALLRHAAEQALSAHLGSVVVVLGHAEEACRSALGGLPVQIVYNPDWSSGMGSSIQHGLQALATESLNSVIIMLCDQPHVDSAALAALCREQARTGAAMVATSYDETSGPPALFTSSRFSALRGLPPQAGAKSLIIEETSLSLVHSPLAAVDIDTPEDLALLEQTISSHPI